MSDGNGLNSPQKFILISSLPWRIAKHHFIKYNPKRPYITFSCVLTSLKDLRSHINWTTYTRLQHLRTKVINIFCKPKISNFVCTLVYQNVCWLKVAMNNFLSNKLTKPTKYLSHYFEYLFFFEFLPLHQFFQVSIFAKLCDDVKTIFRTQYILEFYYVGMVEPLEKINLREYGIFQVFIVGEGGKINFFDSYFLFRFTFNAFIDLTIDSLSQTLRCLIGIVSDDFYHYLIHQ